MIDLKFLRENPEIVKQNIKNKFQDQKLPLVDEVIELDAKARATQKEADELRASRNTLSKQIGQLMGQGKKEEAEAVKAQVSANAARLAELEETEKELQENWKTMLTEIQLKLIKEGQKFSKKLGQWDYFGEPIGDFNTEYAYRALVALAGLGANTVEVALYPKIEQDADGNTLLNFL